MAIIRSAMLTIRLSSSYVLIITTPSNKTRSGREHVPRQPHRCMRFRGYFEEYLSAAPIHHVGVSSFQTTWTSEVEREALRRAYNANRHRDNSLKTRRSDRGAATHLLGQKKCGKGTPAKYLSVYWIIWSLGAISQKLVCVISRFFDKFSVN